MPIACSAAFPTVEPRATGHIPQMLELIGRLIDSGHAYASDGDVYFAVGSFPRYGQLSGQRPDDVQPAADTAPDARKRDPRDFALWKSVARRARVGLALGTWPPGLAHRVLGHGDDLLR